MFHLPIFSFFFGLASDVNLELSINGMISLIGSIFDCSRYFALEVPKNPSFTLYQITFTTKKCSISFSINLLVFIPSTVYGERKIGHFGITNRFTNGHYYQIVQCLCCPGTCCYMYVKVNRYIFIFEEFSFLHVSENGVSIKRKNGSS